MARPIGVFDSGMGGISVLKKAIEVFPHESFIYYGDNKNTPYGEKNEDEILRLSERGVQELIRLGARIIIIACNTATAASLEYLKANYRIPIIGIEPPILWAESRLSDNARALMMATEATVKLPAYKKLRQSLKNPERVVDVPCSSEIVKLIERGHTEQVFPLLLSAFEPLINIKIDVVVLGCTHYPLIKNEFKRAALHLFGYAPAFTDGTAKTIKQLKEELNSPSIKHIQPDPNPKVSFYTSGDYDTLHEIFKALVI